MCYGYREGPGWYQGDTRPARGSRDREVVFRMLMVNADVRTTNLELRTQKSRASLDLSHFARPADRA